MIDRNLVLKMCLNLYKSIQVLSLTNLQVFKFTSFQIYKLIDLEDKHIVINTNSLSANCIFH